MNKRKQNMNLKKLTISISNILYYQYMDLFSRFSNVFLI